MTSELKHQIDALVLEHELDALSDLLVVHERDDEVRVYLYAAIDCAAWLPLVEADVISI
jgi:hypothetical protein